jgi:hypothetical protein
MNISWSKLLVLVLLAFAAYSIELEESHDIEHEFCWKDSYGRGVGTIPTECGALRKIGLLCYDHCPSGYSAFGFDCHQNCPADFRNDGLFCRHAEYGRGGGYPWHWFETNNNGMIGRCERDHGKGKCEMWGAIAYPKCKPGYHTIGCCICRPSVPNCAALGMNGGLDLSCAKKLIIGKPRTMSCAAGLQYDAGLCYKKCNAGFYGVGPVCWADAPKGWVGCGMGAAKDSKVCKDTIIGQITSVGEMALSITSMVVTAGGSAAATGGAKAAANVGKIAKIKATMEKIKKFITSNKKVKELIEKAKDIKKKVETVKEKVDKVKEQYEQAQSIVDTANKVASEDYSNYTEEDYARLAASVAALADPTGIAGVIENYTHPKCSKIFKK